MRVLGIIDGVHDSGVAVVANGRLVSCINEERLSRVKMQGGFPERALAAIAGHLRDPRRDCQVAVAGLQTPFILGRCFRSVQKRFSSGDDLVFSCPGNAWHYARSLFTETALRQYRRLFQHNPLPLRWRTKLLGLIVRRDLPRPLASRPMTFIDHHAAHAASAYFCGGKEKALCITADGVGDGVSLTVSLCSAGRICRLFSLTPQQSYAYFYAVITALLGFTPFRHEGKILGLAAHGDESRISLEFPLRLRDGQVEPLSSWGIEISKYLTSLRDQRREDICAWLQGHLERHVSSIVQEWVRKLGVHDVVLAGGLFANVRLNQKIHELPDVDSVFIFPHMGDGGLGAGAALAVARPPVRQLRHVYLGMEFSDREIESVLDGAGLEYTRPAEIEVEVAQLLARGKVVARFNGRMEYGPRALGNRSILYQATDPSANHWLNERLDREEFMPFAPATLAEYADQCYRHLTGAEHAAKFMTITFDCTEYMKQRSAGAVHIDGTARPQIVHREDNSSFYKIIDEYRRLTSLPSIINTSFNIHEEPIVCTPSEAVSAFKRGHLDHLAIGPFLVAGPRR